jgi:hypothetical protein
MFTLTLVGLFSGFFLAVLDPILEFVALYLGGRVTQTLCALLVSALGTWLAEDFPFKLYALHVVAGAFLGVMFYTIVEKVATYRPTIINSAR